MTGKSLPDVTRSIALLGGSFDPVHNGHLISALDAKFALGVDELRLLPCHIPPHKKGLASSAQQRLAMLTAVVDDCDDLGLDARELLKSSPSYTIETLESVRNELGDEVSLVFIIGWDSLQQLNTWFRWRDILAQANIAVMRRPTYADLDNAEIAAEVANRRVSAENLRNYPAGKIAFVENLGIEISATDIRSRVKSGKSIQFLVPESVKRYIENNALYSSEQKN